MKDPTLLEAQKELLSSTFGQAQAYTNVVLAAGYAGFFGIWSFVKDDLSPSTMFISAFLITISLGLFVLWEVIGMYARNQILTRLAAVVANDEKFTESLTAYKQQRQEQNIKLIPVWRVILAVTVSTAVVAYFILLVAFVNGIWVSCCGP